MYLPRVRTDSADGTSFPGPFHPQEDENDTGFRETGPGDGPTGLAGGQQSLDLLLSIGAHETGFVRNLAELRHVNPSNQVAGDVVTGERIDAKHRSFRALYTSPTVCRSPPV